MSDILGDYDSFRYLNEIVLVNFRRLFKLQPIRTMIIDTNCRVLEASELALEDYGIKDFNSIYNKDFKEIITDMVGSSFTNGAWNNLILYVKPINSLIKKVIQSKQSISFISMLPRNKTIKLRLVNYLPILDLAQKTIAIQSFSFELPVFGLKEYFEYSCNNTFEPIKIFSMNGRSELPIELTKRQHEVLFLVCIGLSQEQASKILKISRGALAAIVSNFLCPKFGIAGSSTKLLVEKAVSMKYHIYMPESLCKYFLIQI